MFQVKAGSLLAARAEDGLRLPSGQEDPLIAELTEMISADLRRAFVAARNRGVGRRGSEESNTGANVQENHSVRTDRAHVRFCTLSARWTGAV